MYLKKVVISGFKSFTSKTQLDFEPGITSIVGPNGCGKSNVVDAIRWCLGEQSTKSLRCQNMMDIIFNGSQKRPAMGMAEVSLLFDNSAHTIPLDFEEIVVTRKLFRSGESEYFINHVPCRLKDIRDLFLDTGIGYEGYSIMEQGKVEFILTAKPEERRELFEEAAGVSKYNARRDESLRKLEKVQFDLTRIQDTVNIVKDQIRQLDLAVKKAKQYQNGLDEFKKIEISDFLYQKQGIEGNIASEKEALEKIENNLYASTALLDKNEARTEECRLLLSEKEKNYSASQAAAYKIDSEITVSENRSDHAKKRSEEIISRKDMLSREVRDVSLKLCAMITDYKRLIGELSDFNRQYNRLEHDLNVNEKLREEELNVRKDKQRQLQALKENLTGCDTVKTKYVKLNMHNATKVSRISGEQFSLEKEYAKLHERDLQLTQEHQQRTHKLDEMQAELQTLEKRLQERIDDRNKLHNDISANQTIDNDINQKQLKICARISALSDMIETDPCHTGTKAILSRTWQGIYGPIHRLITFPDEYRYLIIDGLGDYLNYFVSETIEEAEEAIRFLKNENCGRARFFVLETLSRDIAPPIEVISSEKPILSFINYDPRIENLMRFLLQTTYCKGSTVYCNHIIYGGAEYSSDAYTVAAGSFQEKDQLESQLVGLQQTRKIHQETIQQSMHELKTRTGLVAESEEGIRQYELTSSLMSSERNKTGEEQIVIANELCNLYKQLKDFHTYKNSLHQQIEHNTVKHNEIDAEMAGINRSALTIERELNVCDERLAKLTKETNDEKISCSRLHERLRFTQQEIARIKTSHEEMAVSQVSREEELNNSQQQIQEQTDIVRQERLLMDDLFRKKEVHDKLLQDVLDDKEKCQQEIHTITEQVHELRQRVNTIRADKQATEIEYEKCLLTEQNIAKLLSEKYGITLEQASAQFQPEPLIPETASKLKNRLEAFGAVNLAAPEEYNQLEARFNFLKTQHDDIVKAKDDLHRVIQKINATTKENFHKTFHQVRENFKKIYQILFEGGEADIRLTDESNLLETGVEIFAQPPGKKLQNISLLSGGERALTASALLFAFFMVKPSPVCILDEVDASLDEANVGRFIRMIKDFVKETQFLIITHNKRTMEISDTLYGVTMEEHGVSKLISIKLTTHKVNEPAAV